MSWSLQASLASNCLLSTLVCWATNLVVNVTCRTERKNVTREKWPCRKSKQSSNAISCSVHFVVFLQLYEMTLRDRRWICEARVDCLCTAWVSAGWYFCRGGHNYSVMCCSVTFSVISLTWLQLSKHRFSHAVIATIHSHKLLWLGIFPSCPCNYDLRKISSRQLWVAGESASTTLYPSCTQSA